MTISIFVRCQVKDFDTWKASFDSGAEFIKAQGVIASQVLRGLDNPNLVIVAHQFADATKSKSYLDLINSDLFREGPPVKEGGMILETLEIWMGEVV